MSTITKEQIEQYANAARLIQASDFDKGKLITVAPDHMLELARIALASIEAEPVAFVDPFAFHNFSAYRAGETDKKRMGREWMWANPDAGLIPVYATPPAPVSVPDIKWPEEKFCPAEYAGSQLWEETEIWNKAIDACKEACRTAMLQGAEPVSNRDELRVKVREAHAEWSQATFGDVGPVGPLKHLSKEALEAAAEPGDLSEWADMQFLLWDAQRNAGITDEQITQAMIEKLEVNKARQWPEPKDGEPRLHIKPTPKQEVKQCT